MANDLRLQVILSAIDKITRPIKSITDSSNKTAQALRQNQERLKALQAQQRDVDSFKALQAASKQTSDAMRANRERIKALQDQMARNGPSKQLAAELERAKQAGQRLGQTFGQQQQRLKAVEERLESTGIKANRLGAEEKRLQRNMEQTNSGIEQQQQQLKRLAEQHEKVTKARASYEKTKELRGNLAATGSMATVGGAAAMAAMSGQAFENQRYGASIAAQLGQGTQEATQYRAILNDLFSSGTGSSLEQVSEALAAVTGAFGGIGKRVPDDLKAITAQATAVANAFKLDVNEAVETSSIMVQNKLAKDATAALDLMTRGMQNLSVNMRQELPEILHEYSNNFRAVGYSGHEAMNILVEAGSKGKYVLDKTADSIKEFTNKVSESSDATKEAFKKIGLNGDTMAKRIAIGGTEGRKALDETVKALVKVKNPLNRAQAAIELFGDPVTDLSVDKIPEFLNTLIKIPDRLGKVEGAANAMGNALNDNATDALALIPRMFGGELTKILDQFAPKILHIANAVKEWMQANPGLTNTLAKVSIAAAALVTAGGALTLILAGLVGPFAMAKLAIATFGITSGIALSPILLVIAAIATLAAGAYLLWSHWETIGPQFAALWGLIKSSGQMLLDWFMQLPARFMQLGGDILRGLASGITSALGGVKDAIVGAAGATADWFNEKLGIHSPSRVFAELGGYTMEGLSQGINQSTKGPLDQITRMSKQLTAASALSLSAMPALAADIPVMQSLSAMPAVATQEPLRVDNRPPLTATVSSGTGMSTIFSPTINMTVNATPGMNEDTLAVAVRKEVEKVFRQEEVRRRSRLTDLD